MKSLKIKTHLLAITGRECMTSTGASVPIKMLTSYLQSLQLNVNKPSTCTYKLQIGHNITQVTKAFCRRTCSRSNKHPHCCCGPNYRHNLDHSSRRVDAAMKHRSCVGAILPKIHKLKRKNINSEQISG